MEIYQPMLFVGLGGTGGKIGTELERRLRRTLCGPDGANAIGSETRRYLPFQLPSCFQFVYADLDEREAHELRRQAAPPGDHERAVSRTAHVAANLVPVQRSYPDVAQGLRINAEREVRDWLPPADGEPRIAPLSLGAGQLPTIARASLFETIATSGVAVAQRPILEAINALSTCAEELAALGGSNAQGCDVFVAFSVAGGTGTGIFYDYLHLIADAFRPSGIGIQIHPLVVMPSAFPDGQGGGKPALLNAGRGLLDLSRLVDDQNMRAADTVFRHAEAERDQGLSVSYPGHHVLSIEPSTIQTAFLFSRTPGLTPADLHRSIVSFILAMAGIRSTSGGGGMDGPGAAAQNSFINSGVKRQTLAPSGIGSRSTSTAAVASLSLPRGEILDILAAHLLSEVVKAADRPAPGEDNMALIQEFLGATGLTDLAGRPHHARSGAQQLPSGAGRAGAIRMEAQQLAAVLREQVPAMARNFQPRKGLMALLNLPPAPGQDPVGLLRAERAIFGHPVQAGEEVPVTVHRVLLNRAVSIQVADDPPDEAADQDRWLDKKVLALWNRAWAEQRSVWEPKLDQLRDELQALTGALRRHRSAEETSFAPRVTDLFADRKAAPYFLPDLPRKPEEFYRKLREQLVASLEMTDKAPDETRLLTALLGQQPWRRLAEDSADSEPERAVAGLRRRIDGRIRERTDNGAKIVPRLADLLTAAAGMQEAVAAHSGVRDVDRDRFHEKLTGMIPSGLLLQAAGQAKILITYPVRTADPDAEAPGLSQGRSAAQADGIRMRPTRNNDVEDFITRTINIGHQQGDPDYEFSPTDEESLTVVLIRTSLGITDVPEVRHVMNFWADTLRDPRSEDFLKWRQRVGYHYDWLLSTAQQRRDILQRILIAMWNGQVDVLSGTEENPSQIEIRSSADSGPGGVRLRLPLLPFGPTSPWGNLLHAYEESTLAGDEMNRHALYDRLMNLTVIAKDTSGRPAKGASIYHTFRKVAESEKTWLTQVHEELRKRSSNNSARLRRIENLQEFWEETVKQALEKEIDGSGEFSSLLELEGGWGISRP